MVVPFKPLSTGFQGKRLTTAVLWIDHVHFILYEQALDPEDWHSIFTTPKWMQAAFASISSINTMVTRESQSYSEITSACKVLAKYRLFHSLEYERILSRSQAFTPEKRSLCRENTQGKKRLVHKNQLYDQQDMCWWTSASYESLHMNTVSVTSDSSPILSNPVNPETMQTQMSPIELYLTI